MIRQLKSQDHPTADGRRPRPGEREWVFTVPLEGGDDYLELHVGRQCRDALRRMLDQEEADDGGGGAG